jgi:polyribonucleotide nucleotidyltransferase
MEELIYKIQKKIVRRWLLEDKKRVDGRGMNDIRPLTAEVGLFKRVHGSGMFTRGQTQVMTLATLGPISDAQMLDGIDEETEKRHQEFLDYIQYLIDHPQPNRNIHDFESED